MANREFCEVAGRFDMSDGRSFLRVFVAEAPIMGGYGDFALQMGDVRLCRSLGGFCDRRNHQRGTDYEDFDRVSAGRVMGSRLRRVKVGNLRSESCCRLL